MSLEKIFEEVTGLPATKENVALVQTRLCIARTGLGPDTIACVKSEWARIQARPPKLPSPAAGELLFIRRPRAPRTLTQRDPAGDVRYPCRLLAKIDGQVRTFAANTLPMQTSSKQSPRGHVAVVRPGGPWDTKPHVHKGKPAIRIVGNPLCWRNLSGRSVVTAEDMAESESTVDGYPQTGPDGMYATDILFHAGPPHGYSIGCFTAMMDTIQMVVRATPPGGWKIRLVDVG